MALSLHTEICDMLDIEYPIFSFSHCRDVAVAVSNAGGVGVLGATTFTSDQLRSEVGWIRKHTDKCFGLDVLLPQTTLAHMTREELMAMIPKENIEFMEKLRRELGVPDDYPQASCTQLGMMDISLIEMERELVDTICDLKPPLLACGLGLNEEVVTKLHRAGIIVVQLVGSVRQACRSASYGVDIIVAQGTEAGGHTGRVGTLALVPQVVDAVKPAPVLAAGGIADGRGLVAALALGAVGVWTGTIWQIAHEHPLEDFIKDKLIAATEEDTVVQRVYTGKTSRFLKNKYIQYWEQPGAPKPLEVLLQSMYTWMPLWVTTEDPDRRWEKFGLQDWLGTAAGQGVGLIKQRKSCRQIIYDMVSQAIDILGTE